MDDVREYGKHLALMLAASHFSEPDKQAWAALLPDMTSDQLEKFDALLRADMATQAMREIEDLRIAVLAAQHKRDLSLSGLSTTVDKVFDEVEQALGEHT